MQDQPINQTDQLPSVPGVQSSTGVAPNVPSATLGLAPSEGQPSDTVRQALTVLMNTTQSPRQMSADFAKLKEDYLTKMYGIIIE